MSSLDARGIAELRDKYRGLAASAAGTVAGHLKPSSVPTHLGQDLLHLIGKPEEWTSKFLGQLFSDDPKYNNIFGGSEYWSQVGFFENFKDLGLNQSNMGAAGPFAAALLGGAVALLNPLDPLNKAKVLRMTKLGVIGKRVKDAARLSDQALHFIREGGKLNLLNKGRGIAQISRSELEKTVTGMKGMLERPHKVQGPTLSGRSLQALDETGRTSVTKSLKEVERSLKDLDDVNKVLRELQVSSKMDIDSIRLADTYAEQARRGQRHLLGFSSPKKLDQLALFRVHADELSQASTINLGVLLAAPTKAAQAKYIEAIGGLGSKIGSGLRKIGAGVATMAGKVAITQDKIIGAINDAEKITNVARGNLDMMDANLNNLRKRLDLNREQMYEVVDMMEVPASTRDMAQSVVDRMPQVSDFQTMKVGRGIREVEETSPDFEQAVPGSRLTKQERLRITPSGLDPIEDVPKALARVKSGEYPPTLMGDEGLQHQVYLTPDVVAVKLHPDADLVDFKGLNSIYGIRAYAMVDDVDGPLLMMKRLPASTRVTPETGVSADNFANLIGIAKELGLRGKALTKLTPEDLLINPLGGVQLINPNRIADITTVGSKTVKQNEALRLSNRTLEVFANEHTTVPRGGARDYVPLKNATAARNAPLHAAYRGDPRTNLGERANIDDILFEAVNTRPERDFIRALIEGEPATQKALLEFARQNKIEAEYLRQFDRIQKGLLPNFTPVVVQFDYHGALWVRDGFERLVAAKMLGADYLPIEIKRVLGEVPDPTRSYFLGASYKLSDVIANEGSNGVRELGGAFRALGSPDYRIIRNNQFQSVNPNLHAATREDAARLTADTGAFAAIGVAGGEEAVKGRQALLARSLRQNLGRGKKGKFLPAAEAEANVSLALADAAESAEDVGDFVDKLRRLTQNPKTKRMIDLKNLQANAAEAERMFETVIRPRAKLYLDSLAENGFLRRVDLDNLDRRNILMGTSGDLVSVDNHSMLLTSANKTTAELDKVARHFLNSTYNAEDIEAMGRVILRGTDGQTVVKEVRSFASKTHPKLRQLVTPGTKFRIDDEELKVWREVHGILPIGDKVSDADKALIALNVGGRILRSDRRNMPFFMTLSGDVFVSHKHNDVEAMLKAAFGDRGPIYAIETGVLSSDGLVVDGLLGTAGMDKMGKAEIRALRGRMQALAQKMEKLGLSPDTKVKFNSPFDRVVWDQVYGEKRLKDLVRPGFKLVIPKDILNMPLDNRARISGVFRPRFKDNRQQALMEFVEKNLDDVHIEEFKRGLSDNYLDGYYPRRLTPEAKDAMNEVFVKLNAKNLPGGTRTLRAIESFRKQRVFTDLTTRDVNNMFEAASKHTKGKWKTKEEMVASFVEQIRKDYEVSLDPKKAVQYLAIADSMPGGALFFMTDPITAFRDRFVESIVMRKGHDILDTLTEAGAALDLPISEFNALSKARGGTEGLLNKTAKVVDKLTEQHTAMKQELVELKTSSKQVAEPRINKLTEDLAKKEVELNAARMAHIKNEASLVDTYGPMALDYDAQSAVIHIRKADALRMIEKGQIDPGDLVQGFDDALVSIPVEKYINKLEANNVRVVLFTKEGQAALEKYFQIQKKEGFDRFIGGLHRLTNIFRLNTLFPIPAFHGRNVFGLTYQAWLGGMLTEGLTHFTESNRIMKILAQKKRGVISLDEATQMLDNIVIPSSVGTTKTARELLEEFHKRGGFQAGGFANEYANFGKGFTGARVDEFQRVTKKLGGLPSISDNAGSFFDDHILIRAGLKVGEAYESRFRMAGFLFDFRKSGDLDSAEKFFKEIFYDYRNLNAFERNTMRLVMPFYSWYRHNIPRMMKTLVTEPVKHARFLRFVHQIEQGAMGRVPPDESGFDDYFRSSFGMILSKHKDGTYFVKSGEGLFPMVDIYKLFSGGGGEMLASGISPLFKWPIQEVANHSFFTGRRLEQFEGEPSKDFIFSKLGFTKRGLSTKGPLGFPINLVMSDSFIRNFFRLGNEASLWVKDVMDPDRWVDGSPNISVFLWDFVLGRGRMLDPERTRNIQMMNLRHNRGQLKRALKYHVDKRNTWAANTIRKKILQLDLEFGDPTGR